MKFDVIVVGAGPAGSASSLIAAKAGLKVLTIERGPEPGSKNVSGAMIRLSEVARVFDVNGLPIEREVKKVKFLLSSNKGDVSLEVSPLTKLATISRLKFDKFLWQQAENYKALLVTKTTVVGIKRNSNSFKVITERGEVEGDKVVLAEGVNALNAMQLGIRPELTPESTAQTVKEVYSASRDEVSKRFGVGKEEEGVTWRVVSSFPIPYVGFLYTYKDSVAVGVGVPMHELIERKIRPYDVLEEFKKRFGINELVKGFSLREYSAKIIPEDGFPRWKACKDGIYVAGDAIGLVNPFVFNGIGPAIISGSIAGRAAVESWGCSKYAEELYKVREIREIAKLRPIESEMLAKGYLSLYVNMATDLLQSWISGDLSEVNQYRSNLPTFIKHFITLWGALS